MKTENHKCFLCGRNLSLENTIWVSTKNNKLKDDEGKPIHTINVLCDCGLAQVYNPLTAESLDYFYKEQNGISPYRKLYPCPEYDVVLHTTNMIEFIQNQDKPLRGTTLIVGGGSLTQQSILEKTFRTPMFTLDPSLEQQDRPLRFDNLICMNTLEHVYNPVQFLEYLSTLAKTLYLSVPNLISNSITMPNDQWFSRAHIYHFTNYSLYRTHTKAGWEEIDKGEFNERMGSKIYLKLFYRGEPYKKDWTQYRSNCLPEIKNYVKLKDTISKYLEVFNDN